MTLLTVVQDVCAAVGVARPATIFGNITNNRTQQEMLALANEMAQRIAYDHRDWMLLRALGTISGDSTSMVFPLPADFKRLIKTAQLWRSSSAVRPMTFISDTDEWLRRRSANYASPWGEWAIHTGALNIWPILSGPIADWHNSTPYWPGSKARDPADDTYWQSNTQHVSPSTGTFAAARAGLGWTSIPPPVPNWVNGLNYGVGVQAREAVANTYWQALIRHTSAATGTFADDRAAHPNYWQGLAAQPPAQTVSFVYLVKNCINLATGGLTDAFVNDADTFRLDERLLKLGMIWQWKANKGSPYAEDLGTYTDALAVGAGADKPSPIIIGRLPISSTANVATPWPPGWGPSP